MKKITPIVIAALIGSTLALASPVDGEKTDEQSGVSWGWIAGGGALVIAALAKVFVETTVTVHEDSPLPCPPNSPVTAALSVIFPMSKRVHEEIREQVCALNRARASKTPFEAGRVTARIKLIVDAIEASQVDLSTQAQLHNAYDALAFYHCDSANALKRRLIAMSQSWERPIKQL